MERYRILAVDDSPDALDLIRMTLDDKYDVLTLDRPKPFPDYMEIFEPDLCILDVMMPQASGFQLIEFMKKSQAFQNTPVIFLTAKGAVQDQKYGYSLGAALYLTKPFEPNRLIKNIKVLFETSAPTPRPKKYSMREVELRLSVQAPSGGVSADPAKFPGDGVNPGQEDSDDPAAEKHWID